MTQDLTVLVIGAGANADFRLKDDKKAEEEKIAMPTGEQLVEKIADWEGQVLPNLVYGYLLAKAEEIRFNDYNFLEVVSHFLIKGELQWGSNQWIRPFLNDNDMGTGYYQQKNNFLKEIGWNTRVSTFNKEWTYNKIKELEPFDWYYKISEIVKHYQPFSIDEMLDSIKIGKIDVSKWTGKIENDEDEKRKLIQAGKDLIALFLLQSEDKKVFDYDSACWYRHLRNAIITCGKNKDEIKAKLKNFVIISFNYDRSLDYFLRTRVSEFYDDIKVIYPYKSLAENGIWDVEAKDCKKIPYGRAKGENNFENKWKNFEKAKELAKNLKVIGELEEDEEGKKIIAEIQKSMLGFGSLYFLGFAFHPENCRIMGMEDNNFQKKIRALRVQSINRIFYTNFKNSEKIRVSFESVFSNSLLELKFGQSSIKGTYDALLQDFDLKI